MLSNIDITRIVNGYIGVKDGYLGDFSYKTHKEFYPMYCNLDIDLEKYEGTTREKFIKILQSQNPKNQTKILKGILEKYPFDNFKDEERKKTLPHFKHIHDLILKLEHIPSVEEPDLAITSDVVQKAIDDAKVLIQKNGSISAIDRIHTVLHGYLKEICKQEKINISIDNPSLTNLFKEIRKSKKLNNCTRSQDIDKIINSMANILDAINTIRNNASVAHPNENLLNEEEANLVINISQTILQYLNSKFKE
ncbi:MAG: abortive infection family protein [Candidatus Woesearchaeota archaeon]|jgi:transcriptional regulator with PAS, ATPase and Fis domain